jgi:SAM-dependent methyltransferase
MHQRPDYGIDSPAIVLLELLLGCVALAFAAVLLARRVSGPVATGLLAVSLVVGLYLCLMAVGMLYYSVVGKRAVRDRLVNQIAWRGEESVLDVGCGRGLLLIGIAHRLTTGKAIGVDVWAHGALTGNRPDAVLHNAQLEGVADRVQVEAGDARHLPLSDASFDVVVSNFVVHEMESGADREQMLREIARVLKPGGQVALVDFIFTAQAAQVLSACGLSNARRVPLGGLAYWTFALVSLGIGRLCQVTGTKAS